MFLVLQTHDRRGGVEVERSPRMREIGVRSPVGTDLSRLNRLPDVPKSGGSDRARPR